MSLIFFLFFFCILFEDKNTIKGDEQKSHSNLWPKSGENMHMEEYLFPHCVGMWHKVILKRDSVESKFSLGWNQKIVYLC